ncbi:MAG: DUF2961 domain-containing protein [Planctomycetes bacterium]|nr:DUF2961 domain-containing protein [Planctomycetota bacterium]
MPEASPSVWSRAQGFVKRNRAVCALVGAGLVAAAIFLFVSFTRRREEAIGAGEKQRKEAPAAGDKLKAAAERAEAARDWRGLAAAADALRAAGASADAMRAYDKAIALIDKDPKAEREALEERERLVQARDALFDERAKALCAGFYDAIRALPAEEQQRRIATKLSEVHGTPIQPIFSAEGGAVVGLYLAGQPVRSLEPLRGLPLKSLNCEGTGVSDLGPLRGMPLRSLNCRGTQVSSLEPLRGMPLTSLNCEATQVSDLTPLRSMPLESLNCGRTQVGDLSPLAGMPLASLNCALTRVGDLAPLKGMPLDSLSCMYTRVADLAPLKGMPLTWLNCEMTRVSDLSPLEGMALDVLTFTPRSIKKGVAIVRAMKTLREVGDDANRRLKPDEFWMLYDAGVSSATADATAGGMDVRYFLERLRTLAHLPELDDTHTAMSSTWDRSGGNRDGTDFKRIEGTRNVLLDEDGPGCIHRIFTGRLGPPVKGTRIQIVLDHAPSAIFDMAVDDFFAEKGGPFPYPLVFHRTYPGTLFPIPFQKHCLVTLVNPGAKNWGNYWQVTWTRYGATSQVRSLTWPLTEAEQSEAAKTADAWLAAESGPPAQPATWAIARDFSLGKGEACDVTLDGCGVVRQLRVAVEPATPETLRGIRLKAFWDGSTMASVDVPLGYLFGHGDHAHAEGTRFNSLLLGVTERDAYSCFPMPFARGAVLRFENLSPAAVDKLRVLLDAESRESLPTTWGRFHATWTERPANEADAPRHNRQNVHVALDRSGFAGKYVGTLLQVHWFLGGWWGEGDWLIWTDESGWPPSYHGTGSEEYFNSGWCRFDRKAVSGFVKTHPGDVAVYSFHLNDAFQFRENIRVVEETLVPGQPLWGTTAYWYALPAQPAGSRPDLVQPRPVQPPPKPR